MQRRLILCAALLAATLVVYAQTIDFDFAGLDDEYHITDNPSVRAGLTLDSVKWAFTTRYGANWFPLTWLSHMLDCQLWGLDPAGHHATNVLLHVLNVLLLFGVLQSMTRAPWPSAFVAGLFAVHPLHVESVAWVSERKGLLSTTLGLISLWAYVGYARRGGVIRYLVVAASLALGLMAKSMLVTLPMAFLLLDYWPLGRLRPGRRHELDEAAADSLGEAGCRRRSLGWLLAEKIPLLALVTASSAMTFAAQSAGGSVAVTPTGEPATLAGVLNATVSYAKYIGNLLLPIGLGPLYPHPYASAAGGTPLRPWEVGGSAIVLGVLTGLVLRSRRSYAVVGWLWYLGTLVPVIGLVQVGGQSMADRYAYIPSIGLYVIAGWGGAELASALRRRDPRLGWIPGLVALAAIALFAVVSREQARHWRDAESLTERGVEIAPRNPMMLVSLGDVRRSQGQLEEAIVHYERALEVDPRYVKAHVQWGVALTSQGELASAIERFRSALELEPDCAPAIKGLALVFESQGRRDEAMQQYRHLFRLKPGNSAMERRLGSALEDPGSGRRGSPRDAGQ
jgi:hypothetical protein